MKNNVIGIFAIFLALFVISFLLLPPIGSYFSQDDFHHLRTIMDKNFSDIPSFFTTWQEGQTFYRPLSREFFNLLMYKTFGLNSLPFHIVNFLQIFIIAFLTFRLVLILTKKHKVALLTVFFYLATPVHGVELYYLSSVQQLFAAIFLMSSLLCYLSFLRNGIFKNFIFSIFFFVLALLSHPMAIMFLGVLALVSLFEKKSFKKLVSRRMIFIFIPFLFFELFYILFSSLLNLPQQQVYQPVFSLKIMVNTLGWYTLWAFGLPEMLVDFVGPGFHINPNLIRWYKDYLVTTLPFLGFFVLSLLVVIFKFWKIFLKEFYLIFFVLGFIISLSTFLVFPQHKFIFYMSFAVVWFSGAVGCLLSKIWSRKIWEKIWVILVMGSFLIISWQTSNLNTKTHWAAKRAVAAKFLLEDIKKSYPYVEKGSTFYFRNDPTYPNIAKEWGTSSKQAFYILSGADSLKLLYSDSSIKAYFEDINKLPWDIDFTKVINYTASFPY